MSRILAEYDCFRYKAAVFGSRIQSAACFARRLRAFFGWGVFSIAGLPLFAGTLLLLNSGQVSKVEKGILMGQKSAWVQGDFDAAERSFETVLQESPGGPFAAEFTGHWPKSKRSRGNRVPWWQNSMSLPALGYRSEHCLASFDEGSRELGASFVLWKSSQGVFKGTETSLLKNIQPFMLLPICLFLKVKWTWQWSGFNCLRNLLSSNGPTSVKWGCPVSYARMGELDAALAEADEFSMRRDRLFERLSA